MSSAAVAADCPLRHDLCRWINRCSPRIPRIAPGDEYISTPADKVDEPAWSLFAGIVTVAGGDNHSLRVHRIRVAESGRVFGRSCDALETFGEDCYKAKETTSCIRASTATRGTGSCLLSLCLFAWEYDGSGKNKNATSLPLQLHLGAGEGNKETVSLSPLPDLPKQKKPLLPICPISAAGDLWAPYLTERYGPCFLVMQRFDKDAGQWVEVAAIDAKRPQRSYSSQEYSISPLQGSVVIGDTILLSLYPYHLYFIFHCSTGVWDEVITTEEERMYYRPISKHGVYVEEDDTIYSLLHGIVYAYKLFKDHQHGYRMAIPTFVDRIVPFQEEGFGYLALLGSRVMCAVWISVNLRCNCDTKHALITTFHVKGGSNQPFVPQGLEVLHSTYRRLDLSPSKPSESYYDFIFLQECKELDLVDATPPTKKKRGDPTVHSTLLDLTQFPVSSNVFESSKMFTCCRKFLNESQFLTFAMCERSVIKNDTTLYIICQVASHLTLYKITILDGKLRCHDETLKPHSTTATSSVYNDNNMMDLPVPTWHFFCTGALIFAVPSTVSDTVFVGDLKYERIHSITIRRPIGVVFHLVIWIEPTAIALTNNLRGVYIFNVGLLEWIFCETRAPPCAKDEVSFSGYVVLDWQNIMVSDAGSNRCFMLDIYDPDGIWKVVMPYAECERSAQVITPVDEVGLYQPSFWSSLMYGRTYLNGRSFFARGFIYTCSNGGLAAYELIEHCGSHYLGDWIDLQFSWPKSWDEDRMCLVNVGEDTSSGAVMFCVLQDDQIGQPGYGKRPVRITTVQVITEQLPNGKMKPKKIGHVDMAMSSVDLSGRVHIRSCFAL